MQIPPALHHPPFNVTRASHLTLTVRDLAASRDFYAGVIGMAVTEEEPGAVYLRGLEEACHHSLVLRPAKDRPACARIGLRVFDEEDLLKAEAFYRAAGLPTSWSEQPHQGRTLHARDIFGVPLEFCATMPVMPRLLTEFTRYQGAAAQRIDHFQVHVPDVRRGLDFYMAQGFRTSEYRVTAAPERLASVFLQRKGNPHDLVLFNGAGPRLHHFAFTTVDTHTLIHACDTAGQLGFARNLERGPGRHGPGHALYVYFRDPDGHRVEVFTSHYQMLDQELEPVRWDPRSPHRLQQWALPPCRSWVEEASDFPDVEVRPALFTEPTVLFDRCTVNH